MSTADMVIGVGIGVLCIGAVVVITLILLNHRR